MKSAQVLALILVLASYVAVDAQDDPASKTQGPYVLTDKIDYLPNEMATIQGGGFDPFETLTVQVSHVTEGLEPGVGHEPFTVLADESGSFSTQWHVDTDDSAGSLFRLTVDGSGGRHAEMLFTDTATIHVVNLKMAPNSNGHIIPASGWWSSNRVPNHSAENYNYINGTLSGGIYRNFFGFDLSGISGTVTSVSLRARNVCSSGLGQTWKLYDVSTPLSTLMSEASSTAVWNDLGSGTVFASTVVTIPSATPQIISFDANGIAAVQAALGGEFIVGGDYGGFSSYPGFDAFLLGCTGIAPGTSDVQLVITTQSIDQPPVAICKNVIVYLDASGYATVTAAQVDNGSSDDNGIVSMDVSPNTFTCAHLGPNPVTLTVTDASGNSSSCTATITVQDNIVPVVFTHNVTVQLDSTGHASVTAAQVHNGSSDNCGIASMNVSPDTFSCANLGANTVMLTVSDLNGNSSSRVATVTVADSIAPILECPSPITRVADPLLCTASVNFEATATDNCSATVTYDIEGASITSPHLFPVGLTMVHVTATDPSGNAVDCSFPVNVLNPAPLVTMTGPANGALYPVNTEVMFEAIFTDEGGGSHTGLWKFGSISQPATIVEASDSSPGSATAAYKFTEPGVYSVKLILDDACGGSSTADKVDGMDLLVVVYDPNGGFVTGGGWINSPAGAYAPETTLTGKASFGFVSKYQKGTTVPTGQTQFQFHVANLRFNSASYEWLVVAGAKAQYKGLGTINGMGSYGFILTAIDGQISGGGETDKFRIKIWDKASGDSVVYDNQIGASETADPTTLIEGGSIVIHKK